MRRVIHVVGARPNFMKAAPVIRALDKAGEAFVQFRKIEASKEIVSANSESLQDLLLTTTPTLHRLPP